MNEFLKVPDSEWGFWKLGLVERQQQPETTAGDYVETVKYLDDDHVIYDPSAVSGPQIELVLDHADKVRAARAGGLEKGPGGFGLRAGVGTTKPYARVAVADGPGAWPGCGDQQLMTGPFC